jgi:hypothetical protein
MPWRVVRGTLRSDFSLSPPSGVLKTGVGEEPPSTSERVELCIRILSSGLLLESTNTCLLCMCQGRSWGRRGLDERRGAAARTKPRHAPKERGTGGTFAD